ncbi:MAG: hypothetical protein ACRDPY_24195 [Streptosporangiaceae bacterium]
MTTEPVSVDRPPYPLHAMTTHELSGYRRNIESAIAFFESKTPVPPARDDLRARLDDVVAEEASRARIRKAT